MSRALFIIVIALSLTSCISLRAPKAPSSFKVQTSETRSAKLEAINAWTIKGAVSIRQADHTTIAQVNWRQKGQDYDINLSGPLSFGAARLTGGPGHVTLQKSAKQKFTAKSPEALMQEQLGWQLPISNLYYWVRDLQNPSLAATTKYDQYGHLVSLQQQGWQIHYDRFLRVKGIDMPSVIRMQNSQLKVKLVIKQWQI